MTISAADYEWNFANGTLAPAIGNGVMSYSDSSTPAQTSFATTDGGGVPHIGGVPAAYMNVPALPGGTAGYNLVFTDSGPNGGGAYINQYTFVFDVLIPDGLSWTPFFNTDPNNGNDADWYVAPDGALGIGSVGYSAPGTVAPDTWYRLAFAADLAADSISYYVNGNNVLNGGGTGLDGRFSLYSNVDDPPAADVRLFSEPTGSYTHGTYVSSVMFSDRTMSAAELMALGGPNAAGIVVPEPGTFSLVGMGVALIVFSARRRNREET